MAALLRCFLLEKVGRTCSNNNYLVRRTKLGFFFCASNNNNNNNNYKHLLASRHSSSRLCYIPPSRLSTPQQVSDSEEWPMGFDLGSNFNIPDNYGGGINPFHGSMDSPTFIEAACYAVEQHNKQQNTNLEFVRVVKLNSQSLCGTVYYMTLEATDNGVKNTYRAKIWSNASNRGLWELQLFRLAPDNQRNLI